MPSQAKIKFVKNTFDVHRLFTIHTDISGVGAGRRHQLEVLNKSAIVLITACWEAYVEDVAQEGFEFLIKNCDDPSKIPNRVKTSALDPLKNANDPTALWQIAGSGWKKVLKSHKDRCLKKFLGHFHSPSPENVKELFHDLLGIRNISSNWRWRGMSRRASHDNLVKYIDIRGAIAHRTKHAESVTKTMAEGYLQFVERIVNITDDCIREHAKSVTNDYPWKSEEQED